MNKDTIEGNWKQFKGSVQKKWGKITDDQFDKIEGNRKKLSGAIQKAYGKNKDEADKEVSEWEKNRAA